VIVFTLVFKKWLHLVDKIAMSSFRCMQGPFATQFSAIAANEKVILWQSVHVATILALLQ
jgi:hypothetical protein